MKDFPISKRIFDTLFSFVCFLFFLLIFPFVGFFIILNDGFPILVKLDRISEGKKIKAYKFRTMIVGASAMKENMKGMNERTDGPLFKIKNDPRVTRVGRLLRKYRIDEIPQVINVLKGELSLVGPRPHEPEEVLNYPEEYIYITKARGGITGLSQINGASALSFKKELEFDAYYLSHMSFFLDLKILFKTFFIFLFDRTGV